MIMPSFFACKKIILYFYLFVFLQKNYNVFLHF